MARTGAEGREAVKLGEVAARVVEYVEQHAGCTSREVRHAIGRSEAAYLVVLVKHGHLGREQVNGLWRYHAI